MRDVASSVAFEHATDQLLPLITLELARRLADFRSEPSLLARIEELAGRSTEGLLTDAERAEYEGYARANNFIAVLQAKALRRLADS